MKATTYLKLKRLLAMALAVCVVMSGMTLPSFATDVEPVKSVETEGNGLVLKKSVSDVKADGTYDLTIEAWATGAKQVTQKRVPLDIVLVLDVSGSMKNTLKTTDTTYEKQESKTYAFKDIYWSNDTYYVLYGDKYYEIEAGYESYWDGWKQKYKDFCLYFKDDSGKIRYLKNTEITDTKYTVNNREQGIYTGVLYKAKTTTTSAAKIDTLKTAVGGFIDSIASDAAINSVSHQIAIVKYAGDRYYNDKDLLSEGNNKYEEDEYYYNYSELVKNLTDVTNGSNKDALKKAINGLSTGGATASDYGMNIAKTLLSQESVKTDGRQKVVVLFTDGEPNHSNGFSTTVANTTIAYAKAMKAANAKVFTVGLFGDNPSNNVKNYMSYVSSNYPSAEGMDKTGARGEGNYSLTAKSNSELSSIFTNIAEESLNSAVAANETSVLIDPFTDYFNITGNASDIVIQKAPAATAADGTLTWGAAEAVSGVSATQTENATNSAISVTGFNYISNENLVGKVDNKWQGHKLIITVNIALDPNATPPAAGTTILPTNKTDAEKAMIMIDTNGDGTADDSAIALDRSPEVKITQKTTWKVEYYQQQNAAKDDYAKYTKVFEENKGDVLIFSAISIEDQEKVIKAKYEGANYEFAKGDFKGVARINATDNVLKIYYNKMETEYSIKRNFTLHTIAADGTETTTTYSAIDTPVKGYVGDKVTLSPENSYTGKGGVVYTYEGSTGSLTISSLDKVKENNVFELNYKAEQDFRKDATVKVYHVYHTWEYKLGTDGKYLANPVEVATSDEIPSNPVNENKYKATAPYTVSTAEKTPLEAYSGYTLTAGAVTTITLKEGENKIVLHFDNDPVKPSAAAVTVTHHYTLTETKIVSGSAVTTVSTGAAVRTVSSGIYVGEKFEATEENTYKGKTYVSDSGNKAKLTIDPLKETNSIDLYYTLTEEPGKEDVTVIHTYYDVVESVVEVTEKQTVEVEEDQTTSEGTIKVKVPKEVDVVVGTKSAITVTPVSSKSAIAEGLYVGSSYKAPLEGKSGYEFEQSHKDYESDNRTVTVADGGNTINLCYFNYASKDERPAASIEVQHIYTTHLTTIKNGTVAAIDVTADPVTNQKTTGKSGDSFEAVPETSYDNKSDWAVVGSPKLNVTLQPGTNKTIVINYERSDSNLQNTKYAVNYVYKHWEQYIDASGNAAMRLVTDETITGSAIDGYVKQKVLLDNGSREGYTLESTAPAVNQILGASLEGNTWTFTWVRNTEELLGNVTVQVNHHYTTYTINESNVKTSSVTSVTGSAVKVRGESYTAEAKPDDFGYVKYEITKDAGEVQNASTKAISFTASKDITVDFYYEKTVDNSVPVSYTVKHIYETRTWDGKTVINTDISTSAAISSYKGLVEEATPAYTGNFTKVAKASFNGETLTTAPYTAALTEGTNEFVLVYRYNVPREKVNVKVIHNYYFSGAEGEEREAYKLVDNITAPEDSEYTADLITENNGIHYILKDASPEGGKITVKKGEENVITLNYVRVDTNYTVIQRYYLDGEELTDLAKTDIYSGKYGEVIKAADYVDVPAGYDTYTVSGDITLNNEGETAPVIVIKYFRTTPTTPTTPTRPSKPPVTPGTEEPIEIEEPDVPLTDLPTGDGDGDGDLEEILDDEVPLADVPATGNNFRIWLFLSITMALALAVLSLFERKARKDS